MEEVVQVEGCYKNEENIESNIEFNICYPENDERIR